MFYPLRICGGFIYGPSLEPNLFMVWKGQTSMSGDSNFPCLTELTQYFCSSSDGKVFEVQSIIYNLAQKCEIPLEFEYFMLK